MFGQQNNNSQQVNDQNDPMASGPISDINSQIPAAPAPEPQMNDPFGFAQPAVTAPEPQTTTDQPATDSPAPSDDLLEIKQKALQDLTPLVKHLDQSAVDKFKTTMMMIQASDDKSLLPEAYEAANAIEDSKEKAQALLDVVNEINYFTQKEN
jgi:hypothetical protein